jgi:plastocyanin
MVSKAMVYIGIAVGVIGMGAAIAYGTINQESYLPEDAEFAPAADQGSITSDTGLGAELNRERWHEDPFGDIAQNVRDKAEGKETVVKVEEMEVEAEVEEMEVASGPQTVSVDIPSGTAVPGCEETNECWNPASVSINAGDTIEWTNSDTAAHTVTGGLPADGPSGVFDSSLVLGGAQYAFTFEEAGNYDYFCMVHPWMVGDVQVN